MKRQPYTWTDKKIDELRKICETAKSWKEAGMMFGESSSLIATIACKKKIPRPCMKMGGDRKSVNIRSSRADCKVIQER